MERLFRKLIDYLSDNEFKKFKSGFSHKLYDCLSSGYAENDNEVSLVTKLSETINKTKYENFSFYAEKIHGSRSYVEFNYRDKPTTKELADMVIISSVSQGRDRIFQKIAFIQNKKDTNCNWQIDPEQLFLLKNFPTITGKKGIFTKSPEKEIIFHNYSKTLGNYGLFMNPGEMILAAASIVDSQKDNNKICLNDFKNIGFANNTNQAFLPFLLFDYHPFIDKLLHSYFRYFHHNGIIPSFGNSMPFLNNSMLSRDLFEFIDNWTFFNIGEPTIVNGNIVNNNLHSLSNALLRASGLSEYINLGDDNTQFTVSNNLIVSLMNLQIGKE